MGKTIRIKNVYNLIPYNNSRGHFSAKRFLKGDIYKKLCLFFSGELNGVKYSSELSAADCFELGRQSYNNGDFYHTQLWMEEADQRLKREAKNETVDESEVLEYLAFSIYKQGKSAIKKIWVNLA